MSQQKVQDLLKKINYLEVEMEIQKQILHSIPSDQQTEMEKTIRQIAAIKEDIEALRREIAQLDPEEFARIHKFEQASAQFMAIARETPFAVVTQRQIGQSCSLQLTDGTAIDCLVKACTKEGEWTVVSMEGEVLRYRKEQVAEQVEELGPLQPLQPLH